MKTQSKKNRKEIIFEALNNLEFISGLKQFREYSKEDKQRLIDHIYDASKEYIWLNEKRLEYILKNGMNGNYGEYYSINLKTFTQWVNKYFESNKQQILLELSPKEDIPEISDEEKDFWIQKGKERFKRNWEKSKSGLVPDLDEWAPYWYNKMIEKKILIEDRYNIEFVTTEQKKMLRLDRPFFGESELRSAVKNKIWKLFILECIKKGPDLSKLIE